LTALNVRDRNSPSGSIGLRLCASSQMKAASKSKPAGNDNSTVASRQPATGAEMSP